MDRNSNQSLSPASGSLAKKTVLVVNTGSIKKRFILHRLKKLGLTCVVLNKEKNWAQPYVDHWILADNSNHPEAIQAVKEFLANNPKVKIDGVLTFWEDDILLTAKIVDRFGLIGVPLSIAKKARNKYNFRDFCASHNLLVPKYRLIQKSEDLSTVKKDFNFPVVIKPVYGSSSAFVIRVNSAAELDEMFQYVKNNISVNVESSLADGLGIMAEEYIDGDEVDIDILLQNGKVKFSSIADNYDKSHGIFFIDSGQAIPSSLPEKCQLELLESAEVILEKLGVQNGCIHFEAKYSKQGVYPIEVNLRLGGDYVYSYTKSAWGVDLIEYAAKIAAGEYFPKIKKPLVPKKYIVGWDLHPDESGVLVELDAPEDIKKEWFIEEVELYKKIGDPIFVPPQGFEHLGWLTVSGENILDAQDNLKAALKLISYKVVKFDADSFLGRTERRNRFSPAVLNKDLLLRNAKIKTLQKIALQNQRNLKIGVLGNLYPASTDPWEQRLTNIAQEITDNLRKLGYPVTLFNINNLSQTIDKLRKSDVDLVFNTAERIYENRYYLPHIAALLETLKIPHTGSAFSALYLSSDKIKFKKLLSFHEIPTPAWDYCYDLEDEVDPELNYPLIVKPATLEYSIGISDQSVVENKEQLDQQVKKLIEEFRAPVLVEEYIEGDEYEAYILGNEEEDLRVLPLSRLIYQSSHERRWNIQTYQQKWQNKNAKNFITRQLPVKQISKKLESLITEISLDAYGIIECADYGKVEVKVDRDNNPYVLELNPMPHLCDKAESGLAAAARLVNLDFPQLLEEVIRIAVARYQKRI